MCVIAIAQDKALTADHVKRMFGANRDGAGIAWREHGKVQWRKGLDEEEMSGLCLTVPIPYVAHFRIASCGGVRPELTHPFPVSKDANLSLKGATTGAVVFHNGHYHSWREKMLLMAIHGIKIPTGPWSDSRLMAFVAANSSLNVLQLFDEKIVTFGLHDMDIWGTGWTLVDDLYVSNRTWESNFYRAPHVINVCRFGTCKKDRVNNTTFCEEHQGGVEHRSSIPNGAQGVTPNPTTFRASHADALGGSTQQKTVEEVAQSLRSAGAQGEEGQEGPSHASLSKGREMIGWVRRLNPKNLRTPSGHTSNPVDNTDAEYPYA